MKTNHRFKSLRDRLTGLGARRPIRRFPRLRVESLEDRSVPSASPLAIAGPAAVTEGAAYTLQLFSHDATLSSWDINWGDGTADTIVSASATTATHVFAAGPLAVNISATGDTASGTLSAAALGGGQPLGAFVAPGSGGLDTPRGLTFGADGNLYVISGTQAGGNGPSSVLRYDPTGNFMGTFVAANGTTDFQDMAFGPDGNLYVSSGSAVFRYSSAGVFIDQFVAPGSGGLNWAFGLSFGPDADNDAGTDLYVVSFNTHQVLVYNGQSGTFIRALGAGLASPTELEFSSDNRLYVSDNGPSPAVKRYNESTAAFEVFASAPSGSNTPILRGLDSGSGGDILYVANAGHVITGEVNGECSLLRFNGQTGAFIDVMATHLVGGLDTPGWLAVGPDGNLYVGNRGSANSVGRYAGPTANQSSLPVTVLDIVTSTYANNTAKAIPDNGSTTSTIAIADGGTILDVNVKINITHGYDSDLIVRLVGPDGSRVELTSNNGGKGHNYTNTVFDDEATTSITAGTAPFTGSFRPEGQPLSVFDGKSVTGTWTLEVFDTVRGTKGTLNNWLLTITRGVGPAPLMAASLPTEAPGSQTLTVTAVKSLVNEALHRWQAAGVDTSALHGIDVRIADLGGRMLGQAAGNTITLDDNAAGWGWFVDSTPGDDSEFTTAGNQGERNRMDLLTVLEHEMGHVLGYAHEESGVMIDSLPAGTRRVAGSDVSLADIGNIDWQSAADWLLPADQRRK